MSIDDKLSEIVFQGLGEESAMFMSNPEKGTEQVMPSEKLNKLGHKLIAQIKQAYADRDEKLLSEIHNLLVKHKGLMTGPEWYDRYQAEINKLTEPADLLKAAEKLRKDMPHGDTANIFLTMAINQLDLAAKRAAGIKK